MLREAALGIAVNGREAAAVRAVLLDGRTLPFRSGAFDLVFINHVIHHVADLPPVLRELRRVVPPGGRIVCIEFSPHCTVTCIYRVFSPPEGIPTPSTRPRPRRGSWASRRKRASIACWMDSSAWSGSVGRDSFRAKTPGGR